ncbi:MAG: endonuclease/exonuclease/phosphatase family protein [Prevotella sp.]|nr:endonuclease/exonuclease/phosphatase family protein [Prevotella sp.]
MSISLFLSSLLTLVSLNCENLFDCRHDSLKNDIEWTPEGDNRWTRARYWHKLNNIGREILACGDRLPEISDEKSTEKAWRLPDLVALCEVENDSVLHDLTKRSLLRNARYEYVMTESPDLRGIDVALLYSPFTFRPIRHHAIRIEPLKDMRPTRDILYVCGQVVSGDTLHVFVVHAPSRSGGEAVTQPHRLQVANRLVEAVDSVFQLHPEAKILVAGDFNDYAENKSIRRIEESLIDISRNATGRNGAKATYRFQGEWGSLDHIFASKAMADRVAECYIFDAPFLLEEDETYGGVKPRRNYLGMRYLKGFSDHLPLVARFRL